MISYYNKFQTYYFAQMSAKLKQYDVDLIVYDETEFFRPWNDPLFDYPYVKRKNHLTSYKFTFDQGMQSSGEYTFHSQELEFRKSATCLEPKYYEQFFFLNELK